MRLPSSLSILALISSITFGCWLSAANEAQQCGWCKDKFGLSWQIIPTRLGDLPMDPHKEKAYRVANAKATVHCT